MRAILGLALVLSFSNTGWSYITYRNQRLDHAIWPEHAQKLVVAGTLERLRTAPGEPPRVDIDFRVTDVVLGDAGYQGRRLPIDASSFEWPNDLLPREQGRRCLLVLGVDRNEAKKETYRIVVAAPTVSEQLPRAKNGAQAKRLIGEELIRVLARAKTAKRQEAVLRQLAPILTPRQAVRVAPYKGNEDIWVRRSALAGLIYATEKPEYLQAAAKDVQRFLSENGPDDMIDRRFAAHPYFFDRYFFLETRSFTWGSRWSEEEAAKHLRIFKAMLKTGEIDERVERIINPKQVKSAADAPQ